MLEQSGGGGMRMGMGRRDEAEETSTELLTSTELQHLSFENLGGEELDLEGEGGGGAGRGEDGRGIRLWASDFRKK
jgi:hypothetical protein